MWGLCCSVGRSKSLDVCIGTREVEWTYVDAPELFYGVKGDDFFEEVIPIVTLPHH